MNENKNLTNISESKYIIRENEMITNLLNFIPDEIKCYLEHLLSYEKMKQLLKEKGEKNDRTDIRINFQRMR